MTICRQIFPKIVIQGHFFCSKSTTLSFLRKNYSIKQNFIPWNVIYCWIINLNYSKLKLILKYKLFLFNNYSCDTLNNFPILVSNCNKIFMFMKCGTLQSQIQYHEMSSSKKKILKFCRILFHWKYSKWKLLNKILGIQNHCQFLE